MDCHVTWMHETAPNDRDLQLCLQFASRHYRVILHTNLDLKVPESCLVWKRPITPKRFPVEHRLDTYWIALDQGQPFLSVDHDAFLITPLPSGLERCDLIAECEESTKHYAGWLKASRAYSLSLMGGKPDPLEPFIAELERELAAAPDHADGTQIERAVAGRYRFNVLHDGRHVPRGFVHLRSPVPAPLRPEPKVQKPKPAAARTNSVANNRFAGAGSDSCWVQLGRYGDLINILPILRDVANRTNQMQRIFVSSQFRDLFDGVAYVEPIVAPAHHLDIMPVIREAKQKFKDVVVTQVWANGWQPGRSTESYNKESWRMAGYLDRWSDPSMRLVFDRRDYQRERALIDKHVPTGLEKPIILVNASGVSSPFQDGAEFLKTLADRWGERAHFVNLAEMRAGRVFDLVGLMELADGLVTIDTATLHLAASCSIPVVAMLSGNGGWFQSSTRTSNLLARFTCTEWRDSDRQLSGAMEEMLTRKPRIIHAFEQHGPDNERVARAKASWPTGWIRAPLSVYPRTSRQIGDSRTLPYLRDVLLNALSVAHDHDIIVLTNDDITLLPGVEQSIRRLLTRVVMMTSRRFETRNGVRIQDHFHYGRDLVAWRAGYLRQNLESVPDFILGASQWDLWAAAEARRLSGVSCGPTLEGIIHQDGRKVVDDDRCELPTGLIAHEQHAAFWLNHRDTKSEGHNNLLLKSWLDS